MVARSLGSTGDTACARWRVRTGSHRGDRHLVHHRVDRQLSHQWAGVRLLRSAERPGRHHPRVSNRSDHRSAVEKFQICLASIRPGRIVPCNPTGRTRRTAAISRNVPDRGRARHRGSEPGARDDLRLLPTATPPHDCNGVSPCSCQRIPCRAQAICVHQAASKPCVRPRLSTLIPAPVNLPMPPASLARR